MNFAQPAGTSPLYHACGPHLLVCNFLLQGDIMVPSLPFSQHSPITRISDMTLSFLEDTGWYVPDYQFGGPLSWGRNAGCTFANSSCSNYVAENPLQPYFCDLAATTDHSCTADYTSERAVCTAPRTFLDGCATRSNYKTVHDLTCLNPNNQPSGTKLPPPLAGAAPQPDMAAQTEDAVTMHASTYLNPDALA